VTVEKGATAGLKYTCLPYEERKIMTVIEPDFRALDSFSIPHAEEALQKRDGFAFGSCAKSNGGLALVFDNTFLLKELDMYEAALIAAFSLNCKTNFSHWSPSVVMSMFDRADRHKLQSHGIMIPTEPVIAYRGVSGVGARRRMKGWSWTTSKDMACWFAMRCEWLGNPSVYKCVFDPKDIYVMHNEREEDELIGIPQRVINCRLTLEEMGEGFSRTVALRQQRWAKKHMEKS
jgi:hypothetical protein